jgi:hypothetical protein
VIPSYRGHEEIFSTEQEIGGCNGRPPAVVALQSFSAATLIAIEHVQRVKAHTLLAVAVILPINLHRVRTLVGTAGFHLPVPKRLVAKVHAAALDLAVFELLLLLLRGISCSRP